jgi:4-amino-4-deoxy-L-arabinose transferase-like glycosyltransferase
VRAPARRLADFAGQNGRRWDLLALLAILAGAAFRFLWVLLFHQPFDYVFSDMAGYVARATRLVDGGPLERFDAFYPPGTHLLLAGVFKIFGTGHAGLWAAATVWASLSAATPFFMWRVARLLLSPAAASLTAVFTALWPLHATSAGYFLSETPSLAFLVGSLWAAYATVHAQGRPAILLATAAGILGGAAVTMRPQFLLNLGIVAAAWLVGTRRVRLLAAFAAGCATLIAGAVVYNSLVAGKPTGISENSGITFFIGQCDVHTVHAADGVHFTAPPAYQQHRGRFYDFTRHQAWDQGFFFHQGLDCIRSDGWSHTRILGRDLVDLTATSVIWPQDTDPGLSEVANVSNIVYVVLLPAILIGTALIVRERRRSGSPSGELVLLLHLSAVLVPALVFFGDPRFRMPYDFFGLALLAAVVADALFDRGPVSAVHSPPP